MKVTVNIIYTLICSKFNCFPLTLKLQERDLFLFLSLQNSALFGDQRSYCKEDILHFYLFRHYLSDFLKWGGYLSFLIIL